MSRTTINDIARLAGVSKGTVSRVLNASPRVSESARAAVLRAIAETGYQSNAHARSLATGRAHAIALLIADARDQLYTDPTFPELIEGVHEGLIDADLSLVMLLGGTEAEDRRTVAYLQAGHVDGLIHLNPHLVDPVTVGLSSSRLPFVFCGPRPPFTLPQRNWMVTIDDASGTRQALDHLASRGARTIAMVGGDPLAVGAGIRLATYRTWSGDRFSPDLVEHGDFSLGSGVMAFERILERRPDVDAVFCASDRMAAGALEVTRRRGLRVPEDLLVMGFDDHRIASLTNPPLSTIHQPIREVGRTAVRTLLSAIADDLPSDHVFPTELIIRSST